MLTTSFWDDVTPQHDDNASGIAIGNFNVEKDLRIGCGFFGGWLTLKTTDGENS